MAKRRFPGIAGALVVVAVVLAACGGAVSTSSSGGSSASLTGGLTKSPVIGLDPTPITGNESFEIGFATGGVYPAEWAINNAGGILDGHPMQELLPDDKSDPADAVTVFDRQLALNPTTSWTGGDTTTTPALLPIATSHKLPFLTASGNGLYDQNNDPYLYRYVPPDPANGQAIALWIKQKGYTRVATLFGTDAGSQGDLPGVVDGLKAIKADLVSQVNITPDQANYRADAERLLLNKPQAIVTESDGATAATFFGQLKQLGSLVPIIGTSGTPSGSYFQPLAKAIGDAAFQSDFVAVVVGVPNPSDPAQQEYAKAVHAVGSRLQKPLDQWLGNPYTSDIYDTLVIFALAMDWAKSTVGSVYNSYIPRVTADAPNKTVVHTYAEGKAALAKGEQIDYIGAAGHEVLDQHHNWYADQAVQQFSPSGAGKVIATIPKQQIDALANQAGGA
jgi:ABC-type branched-subunit amino acid transport system substrate-binding protein